jgi:hypothetical protein
MATKALPGQLSFNLDLGTGFRAEFSTPANTRRYFLSGRQITEDKARQVIAGQLQSLSAYERHERINFYMDLLHKSGGVWVGKSLECR